MERILASDQAVARLNPVNVQSPTRDSALLLHMRQRAVLGAPCLATPIARGLHRENCCRRIRHRTVFETASLLNRVWMIVLRAYLVVAAGLVLFRIVQLALSGQG
jgi:hypothetical protein